FLYSFILFFAVLPVQYIAIENLFIDLTQMHY
ncbi:MAG: hypothetical protein QG610_702, partial [Euryarchaeota archaeon]|nr:hypothetical protein [Euryarchaeota archaeon]